MLILECVEQKKECKGPKWGGLLPISSLGSRYCSGVMTGGPVACTEGVPTRMTEELCARVHGGEPGKACRDRPPWALYHDREFPVATEKAILMLRQRLWCLDRVLGNWVLCVSRQWHFSLKLESVATEYPSYATGLAVWRFGFVSRQRHFSGRLKSVATELSLSRQGLSDWCLDRTRLVGGVATSACPTHAALGDRALGVRTIAHDSVLSKHDSVLSTHDSECSVHTTDL